MSPDRRLLVVLVVVVAAAVPAAVLRALCVGKSCRRTTAPATSVPFCSLPEGIRSQIVSGFRDGRSPNVMAVAGEAGVRGSTEVPGAAWPLLDAGEAATVPLVFAGAGVSEQLSVPPGTTLDAVAPTVAEAIGLRRPHPGVRSGEALVGIAAGEPRLVLLAAWKGVGVADLEAEPRSWPVLRGLLDRGAGTLEARTGSLPLDPAAVLATIGTGGLASDHGITGTMLHNEEGAVVTAWGPETPFSVIAALGDDLDDRLRQKPRVGIVGTHVSDRGLIGGDWYVEHDRDDALFVRNPREEVPAAARLLASGYGRDDVPDLLAVSMESTIREMDEALGALVQAAERATGGRVLVVATATGSQEAPVGAVSADDVVRDVERRLGVDAVEATAVGGLFVDQDVLSETGLSVDRVVSALRDATTTEGKPVFADVFPAIAVTFARFC